MLQSDLKYYTPAEYFALEEKSLTKSEYYGGQIFRMAGGSANHSRISGNAYLYLRLALHDRPCEVFNSEMRIQVEVNGLYTYADASIVCGEVLFAAGRDDTVTNPSVLVEVLSPSTRNYDRGDKFQLYRALESFHTYLIIDQVKVYVEYYHRLADNSWQLKTYTSLEQILTLDSLKLEIPLAHLYEKVKFPVRPPRQGRERKTSHPESLEN